MWQYKKSQQFIRVREQRLLSACCVPDTKLNAGDTSLNKTKGQYLLSFCLNTLYNYRSIGCYQQVKQRAMGTNGLFSLGI